jgi:hypothetical protein
MLPAALVRQHAGVITMPRTPERAHEQQGDRHFDPCDGDDTETVISDFSEEDTMDLRAASEELSLHGDDPVNNRLHCVQVLFDYYLQEFVFVIVDQFYGSWARPLIPHDVLSPWNIHSAFTVCPVEMEFPIDRYAYVDRLFHMDALSLTEDFENHYGYLPYALRQWFDMNGNEIVFTNGPFYPDVLCAPLPHPTYRIGYIRNAVRQRWEMRRSPPVPPVL